MHSANIQSWLGSAKTAAGAISGITYAEDVATVELYKKQLEGLTLTQQKLAMTTAGLTTEQQKYILSKIEGTAVVGKATMASLAEISAKEIEVLTDLGVITSNKAEEVSEIVLTKAKYDELMASKLLNENEKRRLTTIFGVTNANIKQAGSYSLLTGSVKTFGAAVKEAWVEYQDKLINAKVGSEEFNQLMSDLTYRIIESKIGIAICITIVFLLILFCSA